VLDKSIGKWLVRRHRRWEDNSKEGVREICFESGCVWNWLIVMVSSGVRASYLLPWS
jgi:hypothetical protein